MTTLFILACLVIVFQFGYSTNLAKRLYKEMVLNHYLQAYLDEQEKIIAFLTIYKKTEEEKC